MIAPVVVKAGIVIGAVGEVATLVIAQATTVDSTAVWVAAIGFLGLMVTSVLTFASQRSAASEQRAAARELRESAARQVVKVEEIHTLVNSKATEASDMIAKLQAQIEAMHKAALDKAEASPAIPSPVTEDPNEGE